MQSSGHNTNWRAFMVVGLVYKLTLLILFYLFHLVVINVLFSILGKAFCKHPNSKYVIHYIS